MTNLPSGYFPQGYLPPEFLNSVQLPISAEVIQSITDLLGAADVDLLRTANIARDGSGGDTVSAGFALFASADMLFDQVNQQPNPDSLISLARGMRNQQRALRIYNQDFLWESCRSLDRYIKQEIGIGLRAAYEGYVTWSPDFLTLWERVIQTI